MNWFTSCCGGNTNEHDVEFVSIFTIILGSEKRNVYVNDEDSEPRFPQYNPIHQQRQYAPIYNQIPSNIYVQNNMDASKLGSSIDFTNKLHDSDFNNTVFAKVDYVNRQL